MVQARSKAPNGQEEASALLTLTTRVARDVVRIDGVAYDMARLGDLSLNQRAELGQVARRVAKLEKLLAGRPNADDEAEYRQRVEWVCRLALPGITDLALARVELDQREVIAGAFFAQVAARGARGELAKILASSTPSRSPRVSRRSTAAPTRRAG